ncbi:hypothetical protein ACFRIB_32735 [Streptomyces mirabilis]
MSNRQIASALGGAPRTPSTAMSRTSWPSPASAPAPGSRPSGSANQAATP